MNNFRWREVSGVNNNKPKGGKDRMSKKHFKELAGQLKAALAEAENPDQRKATERIIERMADVCLKFNDRFDYHRFMAACGIER